jgi:hypothetical protein
MLDLDSCVVNVIHRDSDLDSGLSGVSRDALLLSEVLAETSDHKELPIVVWAGSGLIHEGTLLS